MAFVNGHWGREEESRIRPFADIAQDVSAQWELHLCNTYTLEQLQRLTFSTVTLTVEWFEWLTSESKRVMRTWPNQRLQQPPSGWVVGWFGRTYSQCRVGRKYSVRSCSVHQQILM